jgi:hypothetical protein
MQEERGADRESKIGGAVSEWGVGTLTVGNLLQV